MSGTAALDLMALALMAIAQARPSYVREGPEIAGDFTEDEDGTVRSKFQLASGDTYEMTVRWVREESP